jgi:hypothetical protein
MEIPLAAKRLSRRPPASWFVVSGREAGRPKDRRPGPDWLIKLSDWNQARPFLSRRNYRVALELNPAQLARLERRQASLFRRHPALEWSLPPLQYPGREERLRVEVRDLLQAGFRRFHLNGLGQLDFFYDSAGRLPEELELATGPFLHAANPAALAGYAERGFQTVHLTPESDRELWRRLDFGPVRPALMLFGYIPLLLTRVPLARPRRGEAYLSRRDEEICLLKRDGLFLLVSRNPLSLLELSTRELQLPASCLKIIDLTYAPDPAIARRFLKSHTPGLADLGTSTYNFLDGWK